LTPEFVQVRIAVLGGPHHEESRCFTSRGLMTVFALRCRDPAAAVPAAVTSVFNITTR
jgi:hypothetical protein